MNKKVVWALYDDAESSYKNAIKKYYDRKYEVHSIGINNIKFPKSKNYFYHKIDLSLFNFNLKKELSKLPKPDIILASPPCESWSIADCNGRMFRSIKEDGKWIVMNKKHYEEYNKKCHPVKRRRFLQKEQGRMIGEATIGATMQIINDFKPSIWIIENPLTSKTWDFQEHHWNFMGIKNVAYYSSYDDSFSLKPTIFKSNIKFSFLKKKKGKSNRDHMARGSYSKRSAIPGELIKDIFLQIKNKDK